MQWKYRLGLNIYGYKFKVLFRDRDIFDYISSQYRNFIMDDVKCGKRITESDLLRGQKGSYQPGKLSHKLLLKISDAMRDQYTFLHGSCLSINKKAVAFIGPSGSGKSTAALIGYKNGFTILSDDVVLISKKNMAVMPFSGPMSLSYESRHMIESWTMKKCIYTSWGKLFIASEYKPSRLKKIYFLLQDNRLYNPFINAISNMHAESYSCVNAAVNTLANLVSKVQCEPLINKINRDYPIGSNEPLESYIAKLSRIFLQFTL